MENQFLSEYQNYFREETLSITILFIKQIKNKFFYTVQFIRRVNDELHTCNEGTSHIENETGNDKQ